MTEEAAFAKFCEGKNCAMVVLENFANDLGISEKQAEKITSVFGRGMGHGSICGCVTAAYMALGLRCAEAGTNKLSEKKKKFEAAFTEMFGSIICTQILDGLDPNIPSQNAIIAELQLTKTVCARAVSTVCEILDEILRG